MARTDEDRADFLSKRGFSKSETVKIIETVLAEEGRKPESVFDFVQGITGKRGKSRGSQAVAQRCLTIAGKYGTSGWFGTARREPR